MKLFTSGIAPGGEGVRKTRMRVCGKPALTSTSRAVVNTTIIPRNHRRPTIQEVSCSGQKIRTPGRPPMSRAKWSTSPVATPASTARRLRLTAAAAANTATVDRECVTGRWARFPASPRYIGT